MSADSRERTGRDSVRDRRRKPAPKDGKEREDKEKERPKNIRRASIIGLSYNKDGKQSPTSPSSSPSPHRKDKARASNKSASTGATPPPDRKDQPTNTGTWGKKSSPPVADKPAVPTIVPEGTVNSGFAGALISNYESMKTVQDSDDEDIQVCTSSTFDFVFGWGAN